jgi:hypothetical protein
MASGALDDDVAVLSAWVSELERLADADGDRAAVAVGFAGCPVPDLSGPLARFGPDFALFHQEQARALARGERLRRLIRVAQQLESVERRCADIRRTHARARSVPRRLNAEESATNQARLCRIEYEIAVSCATAETMVLARELETFPDRYRVLERSAHRRTARLQLERIDAISGPETPPDRELEQEREYWLEVAETGVARPPRGPDPDVRAREWIDKSADLVVLYRMVLEKRTDAPARWIGEPVPAGRARWMTCFRRLERLAETSHLFVAGSTHPGEEAALIAAFDEARGKRRDLTLVLAPRLWNARRDDGRIHGSAVCQEARALGHMRKLSKLGSGRQVDAVVVDCVGMLRAVYGLAQGAFVAGSLLASSGHNFCEPLVFGVPTWTGPNHHANIREWEQARRALSPHLRVVHLDGLVAMMRQWIDWVDSGRIEREREEVKRTLMRYLQSLADRSLREVQSVPRGVWECAARFADPACGHCHGIGEQCRHLADMDRFRMRDSGEARWFVPAFARYVLDQLDGQPGP